MMSGGVAVGRAREAYFAFSSGVNVVVVFVVRKVDGFRVCLREY
jgi:hypothetical protein